MVCASQHAIDERRRWGMSGVCRWHVQGRERQRVVHRLWRREILRLEWGDGGEHVLDMSSQRRELIGAGLLSSASQTTSSPDRRAR